MTFGTDLAAGLTELRGFAEERMRSAVEARTLTGRMAQDEATGREVPTYTVLKSDIRCRLPRSYGPSEQDRAGTSVTETRQTVNVSTSEIKLPKDTLLVVTAVDLSSSDPTLVGTVFRVTDQSPADQQTQRRIQVERESSSFVMVEEA